MFKILELPLKVLKHLTLLDYLKNEILPKYGEKLDQDIEIARTKTKRGQVNIRNLGPLSLRSRYLGVVIDCQLQGNRHQYHQHL